MTTPQIVLLVYIVLLVAGGLVGFLKAGSKISLIVSAAFGGSLLLFMLGVAPFKFAFLEMGILLAFFGSRFFKTKKFMPSGMMALVTLIFLVVLVALTY